MFNNNPDFYPTPKHLIDKMLLGIDLRKFNSILEPSAGKGDIVDAITEKLKSFNNYYYKKENFDIDCIEIDNNLQHILRGKSYRVVHDDFLTYNSYKKYDLIIMNPPFAEGDKHLLKALEIQSQHGGNIIALLNAETLNNPYSNSRKDLLRKLEEYNANIEYIENAFMDAERKTNVEVALIKIHIEQPEYNSTIINELKQQEQFREESTYNSNIPINGDFIQGIVDQYNFEVKAGLKLIAEYNALKPLMLNTFKENMYSNPILELKLHYEDKSSTLENAYIRQVRQKYWEALFTNDKFMGLFTRNLRDKYYNKIGELKDYDFSLYNIYTIKIQLNKEMIKGVEDTILSLFDELSHKYHWYDEMSKNIHYYNGWATNKAWKINSKVIIPLQGFRDLEYSCGGYNPTHYEVIDKLSDIEKVFNYLDDGKTQNIDMQNALAIAKKIGQTKKIQLKYFTVTFYKKGTCHIEFTNEKLLHKFNLFGSQHKGWFPPSYGKVNYEDMTPEEKSVVDEFEGENSYNKVMANKDYYIVETSKLLMLA